jgi:hypothetical protein
MGIPWAAILLAGCASPGHGGRAAPTVSQVMDACMKHEMPAARAKYAGQGEAADEDARAYAGFICQFMAKQCTKDPGSGDCPADLKKYGLAP